MESDSFGGMILIPIFVFQCLMGVFFYFNSVALVEDIKLEETYDSEDALSQDLKAGYQQVRAVEKSLKLILDKVFIKTGSYFPKIKRLVAGTMATGLTIIYLFLFLRTL